MFCGACPLEYLDTGLKVIKSVNSCSEHNALDITPQKQNSMVLCLVNGVFQNPEWTLWTHCIMGLVFSESWRKLDIILLFKLLK
jgi:hypothetical protein